MTLLLTGRWQENFIKPLRYARPLYERGQLRSAKLFTFIKSRTIPSCISIMQKQKIIKLFIQYANLRTQ